MRIAIVLLALTAPARADECAGAAASSLDCNALERGGRMSIAMGWLSDSFDPAGHDFEVKHAGYANTIGQFDGKSLEPIHGNGFFLDVRLHLTPIWYAGVDLRAAWGDAPAATFATRGGTMIAWDSAAILTMAGVAGARIPLGRVSVRGELVAGVHGAVLGSMIDTRQGLTAESDLPLVEPRVAVDVWLHHWWALEAFAGANALDPAEHVFGVGLGFHSQAFDGRY